LQGPAFLVKSFVGYEQIVPDFTPNEFCLRRSTANSFQTLPQQIIRLIDRCHVAPYTDEKFKIGRVQFRMSLKKRARERAMTSPEMS
jgi:hypothetical protein